MLRLFGHPRDEKEEWDELLSAYLDGELSDREREHLESRLSHDSALHAELRAMRHTVSLVRELPQVTAPRNFILTESMVERGSTIAGTRRARPEPHGRARAWAAPLLTVATTFVSLLFIVVLFGDLLLPGFGGLVSAPAPMQEEAVPEIALESAPADEALPEALEMEHYDATGLPSPPPASVEPAASLAGEESREVPEMVAEEEEADVEATPVAQALEGTGATPPPAGGGGTPEEAGALVAPTIAPTMTSVTALTPTIPPESPVVSEDELGLVGPTPKKLEVTPELIQEKRETDGPERPALPWHVLEIALGLASLALTFATVRAWRSRRR